MRTIKILPLSITMAAGAIAALVPHATMWQAIWHSILVGICVGIIASIADNVYERRKMWSKAKTCNKVCYEKDAKKCHMAMYPFADKSTNPDDYAGCSCECHNEGFVLSKSKFSDGSQSY